MSNNCLQSELSSKGCDCKNCQKAKEASEYYLRINNSAFDAAIDYEIWESHCRENCTYLSDEN